MLVKAYHKLKTRLDRVKERKLSGQINPVSYYFQFALLRVAVQIIVIPHFFLLGPFKTFTTFARKDDQGSWIDSYNEFIITDKITVKGIIALILIALTAIFIFIYLPIFYI